MFLQKNAVRLLNKPVSEIYWNVKRKFSAKEINKQNKIKNTTANAPEKYEINVKTSWTTNI